MLGDTDIISLIATSFNHISLRCELLHQLGKRELALIAVAGRDERLVLHHYLNHTVGIILANEPGANGWNPWVTVHAPLAFASPPGSANFSNTSIMTSN